MLNKQILEKISRHFPDKASDIKEAILMLIEILDETNQDLSQLSSKKLSVKEYQKSIEIIKLIEELDKNRELILEEIIDTEIDVNEESQLDNKDETQSLENESREKIDYSLYTVNNEEVHDLNEIYRFKRPIAFAWQGKKVYANNFKAILLKVANILLYVHGDDFRNLTDNVLFIGRKNKMISSNPEELLDPRLLDDKITYMHTCMSSDAAVRLIKKLLDFFDYDSKDFKIYLRADYNVLHGE